MRATIRPGPKPICPATGENRCRVLLGAGKGTWGHLLMLVANVSVTLAVMWLVVGALGLSVAPREWRGMMLSAVVLAVALAYLFGVA